MNDQDLRDLRLDNAKKFIEGLKSRKLITSHTWEDSLISLLAEGKRTYMGIDPTADFLHLGHYVGLSMLKRFTDSGYPVVVLVGSFTAQIGDPSFRNTVRQHNPNVENNGRRIKAKLEKFFAKEMNEKDEYATPLVEIIDNYELHNRRFETDITISEKPIKVLLSFINEVCSFVKISELINREFITKRLSSGLTLSECLYPGLQGWDFLHLYREKNVGIQIGGSDQWGNMITGLELIYKNLLKEKHLSHEEDGAFSKAGAITFPLLNDKTGNKFGKSAGNAILILEEDDRKIYEVRQYLINFPDDYLEDHLLYLTRLPLRTIQEIMADKKQAKVILADEVCKDIFGAKKSNLSKELSQHIHGGALTKFKKYDDLKGLAGVLPYKEYVWKEDLQISSLFEDLGLVSSKSEFNRLKSEKGISVSNATWDDLESNKFRLKESYILWKVNDKNKGILLLQRGKKQKGLAHFTKVGSVFEE